MPDSEKPLSILWINLRLLHPLIGGDRIRTYQMLRTLKETCHIHYFCPIADNDTETAVIRATEYCDELTSYPSLAPRSGSIRFYAQILINCLIGSTPFIAKKYASKEAVRALRALQNERFDFIVCDYLPSMIHLTHGGFKPTAPVILFQHNVESLIWQRQAETAPTPLHRWIFRREQALTVAYENASAANSDGQIAVSEDEALHFRQERGMKNVLGHVPTGVDCDYFQPSIAADPATVAFLGAMDWRANIDAVLEFTSKAWPTIREHAHSAKFIVVGRNPAASIRDLEIGGHNVTITGTVDDVRPYLAEAAIMVLPLRVGGGTRIKVFEAMAAGLAIVSTSVGVEGLPVEDGTHLLIAETPGEFADKVTWLIQHPTERAEMAARAREFVLKNHSWQQATAKFLDLCQRVLKRN